MHWRIFTLAALMTLTGCPYTDGCKGLAAEQAEQTDPTDPTTDSVESVADCGVDDGLGETAAIDFGEAPTGGPALSTLTCPELSMPKVEGSVYVDASASGPEAGTKTAPFRTLAKALASAAPKGIVWVAAGTYRENLVIPPKALLVLGGFTPGFGARTNACGTILEAANPAEPVLSAPATDAVRSFTMEGLWVRKGARGLTVSGDELRPATFTIGRCVFSENGLTSEVGGAVAVDNVNARIFRSVFRDNRASKGAALAASGNVTLTVDQNLFERNLGYADHGGGLYLSTKAASIVRNTFRGNATGMTNRDGWGGALIVYRSGAQPAKADLAFNVFTENVAGIGGAVFVDDGASMTMAHDLLYRNRAYPENDVLRGPALYVDGTGEGPAGGSTLVAEYLTVVDNVYDDTGTAGTPTFGGNVYVEGFSKARFTNSIFWNNGDNAFVVGAENELTITSSIGPSQCTSSDAAGLIPASATICKIGAGVFLPGAIHFADEAAADYHEMSTAGHYSRGTWVMDAVTSPAVDNADPASALGGEPMPNGGRSNLGAYGCTTESSKSP